MWLWICLVISVVFLIFWFWFNSGKLLIRIVLIIVMVDCFLTLIGQPLRYWQNYSNCNETSIIGKALLCLHPLAFALGLVFWVILATFLINKLTFLFSYALFFALSIGHSLGAWSWIQPQSQNVFYQEISNYLFYIFLALIFAFVLKKVKCHFKN